MSGTTQFASDSFISDSQYDKFVGNQTISCWQYPNREIRFRIAPPLERRRGDTAEDRANKFKALTYENAFARLDPRERRSISEVTVEELERYKVSSGGRVSTREQSSSKLKPGWGLKPNLTQFGSNARRKIHRLGGVFDVCYQKSEVLFLTGTLPGSTSEALRALADWSGYVMNRLTQYLRRYDSEKSAMYFGCWELQKRGALHWHIVVASKDLRFLEKVKTRLRSIWAKILDDLSDESGVDLWAKKEGGTWRGNPEVLQVRAEEIRKSCAAYLAKYAGKNAKVIKRYAREDRELPYYPSRWWLCSRNASQKLKELTKSDCNNLVDEDRAERAREVLNDLKIQSDLHSSLGISPYKVYAYQDKVRTSAWNYIIYCDSQVDVDSVYEQLKERVVPVRQKRARPEAVELMKAAFEWKRENPLEFAEKYLGISLKSRRQKKAEARYEAAKFTAALERASEIRKELSYLELGLTLDSEQKFLLYEFLTNYLDEKFASEQGERLDCSRLGIFKVYQWLIDAIGSESVEEWESLKERALELLLSIWREAEELEWDALAFDISDLMAAIS